MPNYVINEGGIHHQFYNSRAKIQIFGGAYANGKTAAMCVKALKIAQEYPGANLLGARETYPKLNDSTRKEFYKWVPKDWVRRWPSKDDNTMYLHNGTVVNFRYAKQQGAGKEHKTSNLLSNTYDLIFVDQMEDPGFTRKDLPDLIGRLRGSAEYIGNETDMPQTGPRWLLIGCNPTAGWIYKDWIKPYLDYKESGRVGRVLQRMMDDYETERVEDLIEVITGSTRDNAHNLGEDVIRAMAATYTGVMRERFLEGSWNALEGLIYPDFNEDIHLVNTHQIHEWIARAKPKLYLEAMDYGIAKPTCYGLALRDKDYNTVMVDMLYAAELSEMQIIDGVRELRTKWGMHPEDRNMIYADPSMFRRITRNSQQAGESIRDLLWNNGLGLSLRRGNNEILSGIIKVRSYLTLRQSHTNPFTGKKNAPFLYFNRDTTEPLQNEIIDYYFDEDSTGERTDKPRDINDHAMDMLKYMLTDAPDLAIAMPAQKLDTAFLTSWQSDGFIDNERNPRYG